LGTNWVMYAILVDRTLTPVGQQVNASMVQFDSGFEEREET